MKTNRLQVRVMLLLGVAVCLILPGVLASRALRTAHAGATGALRQDRPGEALDAARVAALTKLQAELKAGAPFSHEETDILGRFSAGGAVDAFEADVLISRVLYAYSIGNDLSADGQELLDRYKEHIAPGKINTADLKAHIQAIELKETPRAPAVAPSNDLCAGAEVIPAAGPFPYLTAVTADITDATVTGDPPLPSCQTSVSRSIWYTFTPSATSSYTISSCADAPTGSTVDDTVIAVYTSTGGCAGTFTEIPTAGLSDGCDDDTCITESLQSVLTTSLTSGTQYFIVVSKFGLTAPTAGNTAVQLRISQPLSPANETCAGAIPLTLNTAVSGTTNGATGNDYQLTGTTCFTGIGQTSSTAPGRDVVYSFTAPSAGNYSFTINFVNGFNAVLYVSTSCPAATPGTPVNITCDNVSGPVIAASNRNTSTTNAAESVQCLALTNGQQVFVFVDETALSGAGGSFIIKVTQCLTATGNDVEPNGTPATANALACGAQGGIVPAGDVDFYTLGTPATGSRVFAMAEGASASSSDFDMRITTTTDTLEYDDANLDTPFGSLAPVAAGTPLTGVASFIRMNHFTAATQSEPYRLYSVVQPPGAGLGGSSATAETEPNDTTPNANSATNNFFSGLAAGDVDMFCFGATAGDVVFIALDTDPLRNNTPFNGALALLSSTGTVLVSVNDGGSTSSTTTGAGSLTATTPNSPAEGIVFTIQTTGNYIARVTVGGGTPSATSDYLLSISKNCALGGGGCAAAACTSITCPANVTQPNDPNQCGAVVTYPAPTSSGTCGTINCSPASGSFFPVGTTTVTCTSSAGPGCTFTVTVQDTQQPSITCPPNQVRSNDLNQCGAVVTYPAPTITDNCPGTFTATCNPPSGSFFPVGTTTVTCTVNGSTAPTPAKPETGAKLVVPDAKASSASAGKAGANAVKGGIGAGAKLTTSNSGSGSPKSPPPSLPKSVFAVLYDQTNNAAPTPGGVTSQNFEAGFDAFDTEAADDFVVPAGQTWTIQQVFVVGEYSNAATATSANVVIYSDSATLPGAPVYTATSAPIVDVAGDLTITLTVPAVLSPGTYWVGVQANENFTGGGQWFWDNRTTISNSGAAWRNPGGGFGVGCTAFGRKSTCLPTQNGPDQLFQILGTSAPIGGGGGPTCTFTVTVNDTQAPTITCSCSLTAVTPTPGDPCVVVNFTTTATDNCPGVTVVCNPPSGTCFPVGVTTVTCTATDASGNTATCSFTISVFNGRLQDDFEGCNNTVLFNTITGDYRWCCHGTIFTGRGKITRAGDTIRLEHIAADRRVRIDLSAGSFPPSGNAALQSPPGTVRCVIQDRDIRDDTCICGVGACQ